MYFLLRDNGLLEKNNTMNLSDSATLNIKGSDYCHIISRISKSETINLLQNMDLTKKSKTL